MILTLFAAQWARQELTVVFFKKILSWIAGSGIVEAAQKEALAEVSKAIKLAFECAVKHAPDMQQKLDDAATQMLNAAVTGIVTKQK